MSCASSTPCSVSTVSASAPPFYPAADTVESVVESALDELNLDDFDVSELEKELNNTSPVSSTLGNSFSALTVAPMCSDPVSIPGAAEAVSPQAFTQSPTSPLGQYSSSYGSSQLMSGQKVSCVRVFKVYTVGLTIITGTSFQHGEHRWCSACMLPSHLCDLSEIPVLAILSGSSLLMVLTLL